MAKLNINLDHEVSHIKKEVYGHFSEHLGHCIYEGIYVGEDSPIPNVNGMRKDVVDAFKHIRVPVLRWPGGCFADEYHWKDGIGPKESRKRMVNTHWGGVVEDNSFGTHEFFELCRQVGAEPYVNGNMGSGTVQEMSEWVEYITFDGVSPMAELRKQNGQEKPWKLKYFGVGNENWGCGGNMRPEYYADEYRRYQTYVRNYGNNQIYKIACGPNGADYNWTEQFMKIAGHYTNAITLHHYTVTHDWENKGTATGFTKDEWYSTLSSTLTMEKLIKGHLAIMDRYDPKQKVALLVDEWGSWYKVEPGTNPGFLFQQNTSRDALIAAINLNIFNKYSKRVHMANIAQIVNVLQAIILTDGDKMVLTPTYHVFDLFKEHQDAMLLQSSIDTVDISGGKTENSIPNLTESVSRQKDGSVTITLGNLSADSSYPIEVALQTALDSKGYDLAEAKILEGDTEKLDRHNAFDNPNEVEPVDYTLAVDMEDDGLALTTELPAASVLLLRLKPRG